MKNLPLMYLVANPPKLTMLDYNCHCCHVIDLLDLIEDNTARLCYPKEAHNGS